MMSHCKSLQSGWQAQSKSCSVENVCEEKLEGFQHSALCTVRFICCFSLFVLSSGHSTIANEWGRPYNFLQDITVPVSLNQLTSSRFVVQNAAVLGSSSWGFYDCCKSKSVTEWGFHYFINFFYLFQAAKELTWIIFPFHHLLLTPSQRVPNERSMQNPLKIILSIFPTLSSLLMWPIDLGDGPAWFREDH